MDTARRTVGLAEFLVSAAWIYRWEIIRAWLYDQGFRAVEIAGIEQLLHYGIPALLVGSGFYLFLKTSPKGRGSPAHGLFIWRPWIPFGTVPLQEAARYVYSAVEDAPFGQHLASTLTENDRLNFIITGFIVYALLYGRRPPSTNMRRLSQNDLRNLHWVVGTNSLREIWPPHNIVFDDVCLYASDLRQHINFLNGISDADLRSGRY
jgi:hypothetical protein